MIIPRKYYENHSWVNFLREVALSLVSFKLNLGSTDNVRKIKNSGYPSLVKHNGKPICTSCGICETSCPTDAIKLSLSTQIDLNANPFEGRMPQKFEVNIQDCIQCAECVHICPVDALSLKGGYSLEKVVSLN
jgi:ferredoxin